MLKKMLLILGIAVVVANAQTVHVRGTVTNSAGKPVARAIVALVKQNLKDTTGEDGAFSMAKNMVAVVSEILPGVEACVLDKGILEVRLVHPAPVNVEFFDVKGTLVFKEVKPNAAAGTYRLDIGQTSLAPRMLVGHASIGKQSMTFKYLPLNAGNGLMVSSYSNVKKKTGGLAKIAADIDSIKVTAEGYALKALKIASYDTALTITLDTAGGVRCEGCGKSGYPKSGKYTIDVEGTPREYMLKLPDNYDPDTQYKLIFCPHWLGGTIDDVVKGSMCGGPYYGLEKLANGTAIFIVPQGLKSGSNTGFSNTKGEDIKFFRAVLKHLNANLCIDQKRIFSTGFSFGGMMSFAVGCAMNDVVRAIAPMSGAFYSQCDSSSQGPIAVWQVHGINDKAVKLADAKKARDYFLARNGCNPAKTIPVEPSPCVAYQDCKTGYPYIYCEFDESGEHHGVRSWAAAAVWEFFSQF